MTELLRCPFCGAEADVKYYGGNWWRVECTGCKTHGPIVLDARTAAERWNTRVNITAPPEASEGSWCPYTYRFVTEG